MPRKKRDKYAHMQSELMNVHYRNMYMDWILSLALKRFKWVNLPDTCNARYLETRLLCNGVATLAFQNDRSGQTPLLSIGVLRNSAEWNMYGEPVTWTATGYNQNPQFPVSWENGAFIYDTDSYSNNWNGIEILASQLARVKRALDINLQMQNTPWLITAPDEKKEEAYNLYKMIAGYEPAVIANPRIYDNLTWDVITTKTDYIGADLEATYQNIWYEVYQYLGIEHLFYEKKAQMTVNETEANNAPTNIRLLDGLDARRRGADHINKLAEKNSLLLPKGEIQVVFNDDLESYAHNTAEKIRMETLAEGVGGDQNE